MPGDRCAFRKREVMHVAKLFDGARRHKSLRLPTRSFNEEALAGTAPAVHFHGQPATPACSSIDGRQSEG